MARITIEDCIEKIPNKFELVLLAAQRARDINTGNKITIPKENSPSIIALKEIAADTLNIDNLREAFIINQQSATDFDTDNIETQDIDVKVIGDTVSNEEIYDANYNLIDDNFNNILLENV